MMMKKTKKVRTCQNMSGAMGGANAFNFLSFVAGVITLSKPNYWNGAGCQGLLEVE